MIEEENTPHITYNCEHQTSKHCRLFGESRIIVNNKQACVVCFYILTKSQKKKDPSFRIINF